jgi:hypothetical protein
MVSGIISLGRWQSNAKASVRLADYRSILCVAIHGMSPDKRVSTKVGGGAVGMARNHLVVNSAYGDEPIPDTLAIAPE